MGWGMGLGMGGGSLQTSAKLRAQTVQAHYSSSSPTPSPSESSMGFCSPYLDKKIKQTNNRCTNFRGSNAHTRRLGGGANMHPEDLRISYSRSLWSTEPVPRWTGEPHQCPQLLYLGLGRRPSGTPETFCWSVSLFQGQMDKEKGNPMEREGRRQSPSTHSPCTAPGNSRCLLLGKLSGPGEGLGSFQIARSGPQGLRDDPYYCFRRPLPLGASRSHPRGRGEPLRHRGTKGTLRART